MARTVDATILGVTPQSKTLYDVAIEVDDLGPGALWPGVVASVSVDRAGEAYFALASSPDALPRAELLVRRGPPVAEALIALEPGARVHVNGPIGRGFDMARLEGGPVALVGVGTAIGPLRSALHHIVARRERFGRVALVYGVRDEGGVAFSGEHDAWREAGVEVHVTATRPTRDGWSGLEGRVQAHLDALLQGMAEGGALVCGMPAMIRETTEALVTRGFRRDAILVNY